MKIREVTDADVEAVEEALGHGCGAWDMEDPKDIIREAWKLLAAPPMKTIRTFQTERYEAVVFTESGETDEESGVEATVARFLFNNSHGSSKVSLTFIGEEQEVKAQRVVEEADAAMVENLYENSIAPYYPRPGEEEGAAA